METNGRIKESSGTRIVNFLHERLARVQSERQAYSLRAFARDLNLPAPVLSEVLRGKRKVTKKLAEKICSGLALPEPEMESLLAGFQPKKNIGPELNIQLRNDEFNLVSDWYYFAILSMAETSTFQANPQWIAKRLGISAKAAKTALETLLRMGLLERAGARVFATGKQFVTTNDIPQLAIQKNHLQGLDLAKTALRKVPVAEREYSANTISFSKEELPQAKKLLRDFRKTFSQKMGGGDSVYRLQMQFYPLIQGGNEQ